MIATAKQVYERLSFEDILNVASDCFQEGSVDFPSRPGEHEHPPSRLLTSTHRCEHHRGNCAEEYLCEVLAALILMPQNSFTARLEDVRLTWHEGCGWNPISWLAAIYDVEEWAVRFRIALLDEGYFCPDRLWE